MQIDCLLKLRNRLSAHFQSVAVARPDSPFSIWFASLVRLDLFRSFLRGRYAPCVDSSGTAKYSLVLLVLMLQSTLPHAGGSTG